MSVLRRHYKQIYLRVTLVCSVLVRALLSDIDRKKPYLYDTVLQLTEKEMAEAVAIAVENLQIEYGDLTILDKATITIHEGERVGLVGSNGCGKSTFMKILTGVEDPDDGFITRKKWLTIGYLPQEFTIY